MPTTYEFHFGARLEVYVSEDGEPAYIFTERHTVLIDLILNRIEKFHPETYSALKDLYKSHSRNKLYFRYKMAKRFIQCNFSEADNTTFDIDEEKVFHYERVRCPIRNECPLSGVVCQPKIRQNLTTRELEVAKALGRGMPIAEIAEQHFVSVNTIKREMQSIKNRTGLKHTYQIISKFASNNDSDI